MIRVITTTENQEQRNAGYVYMLEYLINILQPLQEQEFQKYEKH